MFPDVPAVRVEPVGTDRVVTACLLGRSSGDQLFAPVWTVARQAPLFMGFSRQEYWGGLPVGLPSPGIEPVSLTSPALADRFFITSE